MQGELQSFWAIIVGDERILILAAASLLITVMLSLLASTERKLSSMLLVCGGLGIIAGYSVLIPLNMMDRINMTGYDPISLSLNAGWFLAGLGLLIKFRPTSK
ncbi:MAG: hypothetical protein AAGC74_03420 [Verrucomicrobiota bacterium]